MMVRVAFFAAAKDITGSEHLDMEMDDAATVTDLQFELKRRFPDLLELMEKSTWSLDHQYTQATQTLHHGAEVGMIPPVSGG